MATMPAHPFVGRSHQRVSRRSYQIIHSASGNRSRCVFRGASLTKCWLSLPFVSAPVVRWIRTAQREQRKGKASGAQRPAVSGAKDRRPTWSKFVVVRMIRTAKQVTLTARVARQSFKRGVRPSSPPWPLPRGVRLPVKQKSPAAGQGMWRRGEPIPTKGRQPQAPKRKRPSPWVRTKVGYGGGHPTVSEPSSWWRKSLPSSWVGTIGGTFSWVCSRVRRRNKHSSSRMTR